MDKRFKAIITMTVRNEEILEAENLFPNMAPKDAIKALMEQAFWEATGKTYEGDGSSLEIVELH